jgi:hypothetical protein
MRKIGLGTFMKWAFGEELVHLAQSAEGGGGGSYLGRYATLGTRVSNGGYSSPELAHVHPDALVVGEAVMLLAREDLSPPAGWNPLPDLDDPHGALAIVVEEVMARRAMRDNASLNANLIAMVISYAVMGREPEWRIEQPRFSLVQRGGKPAWFMKSTNTDALGRLYEYETDGYNARAGRPFRGAYRKYQVSQPFAGAVQARLDWYLWSRAMELVVTRLDDGLKAHQITAPHIDCEIWKNSAYLRGDAQPVENAAI